jgi:hypothetical protein
MISALYLCNCSYEVFLILLVYVILRTYLRRTYHSSEDLYMTYSHIL